MKSPHNQRPDDEARAATEEFIAKHGRTREAAKRARAVKDSKDEKVAS
jgi:myo-inositol-1-phosphate synthase